MRFLVATALIAVGCATTAPPAAISRGTLPDDELFSELPPPLPSIAPEEDWALPVDDVEVAPGDHRAGILLSMEKARRAAMLRIAYDELRALYTIDLRTWARERSVYERYLQLADEEIQAWRTRAQRSWWEENGDEFSLFFGLGLGIVLSVAVGSIIAELAP